MKGKRKQQRMHNELLEEEKKIAEAAEAEAEEAEAEGSDSEKKGLELKKEDSSAGSGDNGSGGEEIWKKFQKKEPPKKKKSGLTSFGIKMIAIISMLVDHIAMVFIDEGYVVRHPNVQEAPEWLSNTDFAMRAFGRLAFPLFCYLLVEGYFHTRSKLKYLRNLLVFGIISEIPFDMANYRKVIDWSGQNVFFTLALGLITIMAIEYLTKGSFMKAGPKEKLAVILVVIGTSLVATLCMTDYAFMGVLVVLFMYIFRKSKGIAVGGLVFMFFLINPLELFSMIDFAIFPLYNGERGKKVKYLFYAFYPVHLLILALLRKAIMGL